jgi:hypothetical protein
MWRAFMRAWVMMALTNERTEAGILAERWLRRLAIADCCAVTSL